MPLSKENLYHYSQWRNRYGGTEHAADALCPDHLRLCNTFPEKLVSCYFHAFLTGGKASDPTLAVEGTALKLEIQKTMNRIREESTKQVKK